MLSERDLPTRDILADMERDAMALGILFDAESVSIASMSNGELQKEAHAWLSKYVELVGDPQPNRKNEIHLEYRPKLEIYEEYVSECEEIMCSEPISYDKFIKMWKLSFRHVKIRKYKAVEGKCSTCAILTQLRSSARNAAERAEITKLHYWHRYVSFILYSWCSPYSPAITPNLF